MIPTKAIAVLAFQLEGRVHQPPREYQPEFQEVVNARFGTGQSEDNKPAGDQTAFGYGYLAPPPYTKKRTNEMEGNVRARDRGSNHGFRLSVGF